MIVSLCAASAISRLDNLEFLTDVVPRTMTYKQFKDRKAAKGASAQSTDITTAGNSGEKAELTNGQRTLHQITNRERQQNGLDGADDTDENGDVEMGEQEADHDGEEQDGGASPEDFYEEPRWKDPDAEPDHPVLSPRTYQMVHGLGKVAPLTQNHALPSERTQPPRARHPPARHAYDAVRDRFEE